MARCLALDLGGVVLRINHTWADAAATVGVLLGKPENGGVLNHFELIHAFQEDDISYEEYAAGLADYLGVTLEEARRVHAGILIEPYRGIAETVDQAKSAGLIVGVLSNTNRPHVEHCMEAFEVCSSFDFFGTSYDARANKPYAEFYRWFEERVGARSEEIVFFDDHQRNIDGAHDVGWQAFLVDPYGDPPGQIRSVLQDASLALGQ